MRKGDAQQARNADALQRWRVFAVTLELAVEGWRLLRELLRGVPW